MRASIPARSRAIWVTSRSGMRSATPNWHLLGFGETKRSWSFKRRRLLSELRADTRLLLDTFSRESVVRYFECFNCDFISARLEAGALDLIHPGVREMPTLARLLCVVHQFDCEVAAIILALAVPTPQ